MSRWLLALPLLLTLGEPAWALKPAKHRELLEEACLEAGLPRALCRRAGKQAYETDYAEWTELAAHAQRELGEAACPAADQAIAQVDELGRELVDAARRHRYEDVAIALGRALHTIQDECAHHGMTNPEHAFLSMTDTCSDDDHVSPDVQPAALSCAEGRTREAMAKVASALAGTSWGGVDGICVDVDNRDTCGSAALPTPFMACDFLAEHAEWDGRDSTWHTTRVGDALVDALDRGVTGRARPRSVCAAGSIAPQHPHARVTDREVGCTLTDLLCLGKADDPGELAVQEPGGCTASRDPSWLVGLGLAGLARSRRRRRSC